MKRLEFIVIGVLLTAFQMMGQEKELKLNPLSREEQRVIVHKGTERAWTGEYVDHNGKGTYVCKWCDTPLFRSDDKFDSHCGWPSFDDEITGAVKRIPDPDGMRTEIVCDQCGGHLGHVFEGEGFTNKDTRHCVNSISIKFIPEENKTIMKKNFQTAIFAAGCFWGVEHYFRKAVGVVSTEVGYIGGFKSNPTYKEVCDHTTGHAEAIRVTFDPSLTDYTNLTKLFFEIHDPGQMNRQGPDVGEQYRSEIFFLNENQKKIADDLIVILKQKGYKVVTKLTPAGTFWPAEEYHQDYYDKTGGSPYCHIYTRKF